VDTNEEKKKIKNVYGMGEEKMWLDDMKKSI
jgi:hypothetical protein